MPRTLAKDRTSSKVQKHRKRSEAKNIDFIRAPADLASVVRGLYKRVADRLGVDPSYVSRVARNERDSKSVGDALRRELSKIIKHFGKKSDAPRQSDTGRMRANRTKISKGLK